MSEFVKNNLSDALVEAARSSEDRQVICQNIYDALVANGYEVVEEDRNRPWGGSWRMRSDQADRFITSLSFGASPEEAREGIPDAELSPKILGVAQGERLSYQYHDYRGESWLFLTPGAFRRSWNDEEGELEYAEAGTVVTLEVGQRHRLEGLHDQFTVVAEYWIHTDPNHPSTEADIVRLKDDYSRE